MFNNNNQAEDFSRPELMRIKEILPQVEDAMIVRILKANKWNVERSCEACIAFIKSVEAEQSATDQSTSSENEQSFTSLSPVPIRGSETQTHIKTSSVEKFSEFYNPNGPRGNTILMDPSFLCPPRFRLSVDVSNDVFVDFTILFNRFNAKLGVIIETTSQETQNNPDAPNAADSEIRVRDFTANTSLARDAGIKIGDVITGVENTFFSPGAEIQDVLDALKKCVGHFVQLHCRRYIVGNRNRIAFLGDSSAAVEPSSYHSFAQLLMEQKLISEDRAQKVTESVAILKRRVLQWDTGELKERVRILHQDDNVNSAGSTPSTLLSRRRQGRRTSLEQNLDATFVAPISYSSIISGARGIPSIPEETSPRSADGKVNISSDASRHSSPRASISICENDAYNSVSIKVSTENLRPALATRVLRAEVREDHTVYVILVMDVKSGAEWVVRRRFREFDRFRERLIVIRKSIRTIEFPVKQLSNTADITQRVRILQRFLRKTCSLLCVNSLHPSTASVHRELQEFLDVNQKIDAILVLDEEHCENFGINSTVQVYVHSIMQMSVLDKVYDGFLNQFGAPGGVASNGDIDKHTEDTAIKMLETFQSFLDNLVEVMCRGVSDDCFCIVNHCQNLVENAWRESLGGDYIDGTVAHSSLLLSPPLSDTSIGTSTGAGITPLIGESLSLSPVKLELNKPLDSTVLPLSSDAGEDQARNYKLGTQVRHTKELTDDDIHELIRKAVRKQVEIELYVGCSSHLTRVLESGFAAGDIVLARNVNSLFSNPQTFYGIATKHISPSSWEKVVAMFKRLPLFSLPQDRLLHLIACAKEIPLVYQEEHPFNHEPLGADDFLPIFIYVIVQSRIPCLLALNAGMQALVDPERRRGEEGYYLATLEAAIEHVREVDPKSGQSALLIQTVSRSRGRSTSNGSAQDKEWIKALDHAGVSFDQDTDSDDSEGEVSDADTVGDRDKDHVDVSSRPVSTNIDSTADLSAAYADSATVRL